MKIDILTFSHAVNRGAHMQCYALSKVLHDMGYQVEVIHIELPHGKLSWKGKIDQFILNTLNEKFRKKYYPQISSTYRSAIELQENPPKADIFIVGSDQVWNPVLTREFGVDAFFLNFVPKGCKKIAYAVSFGASKWIPTGNDKEIIKLVHEFDAISVREVNGIDICKEAFNISDVKSVLDPVFLLKDYTPIIGTKRRDKKEIICYPLYLDGAIKQIFVQASQDLKLTPVSYARSVRGKNIKIKLFSSISGWLCCINQSSMVITNSFHCMAFCILFKKNFIVTPPYPGREDRILSILTQLGLANRYVSSVKDFENRKADLYKGIDYTYADGQLQLLRQESLKFLAHII